MSFLIFSRLVMIFIAGLAIFPKSSQCQDFKPTEAYQHMSVLDATKQVKLYWKYDQTFIYFELHAKTLGWIGLGFSAYGGMKEADIVVGWVKDGQATIKDLHGPSYGNGLPESDQVQNVQLLEAKEYTGITMITFSRKLIACDAGDVSITEDTFRLIYAFGESDPKGDVLSWLDMHTHINRGAKSAILVGNSAPPPDTATERKFTFDIVNDASLAIPIRSTYYSCRMVRIPQFDTKQHIIRVEPIIDEDYRQNIHHFVVNACDVEPDASWEGKSVECYTKIAYQNGFTNCFSMIAGWGVGGGGLYFPKNVGMPLGLKDSPKYVILETHYDNPTLRRIHDGSGLRITYTPDLRSHDADILNVGTPSSGSYLVVPPKVDKFEVHGQCGERCLSAGMTAGNISEITVFASMLHTHLAGERVNLRHIRNGTELPYVVKDDHYDFNYQEPRILNTPRTIKNGDSLLTTCTYSTKTRSKVTLGGLSTENEMCLIFLYYYPRIPLKYCLGSAYAVTAVTEAIGIQNYTTGNKAKQEVDRYVITKPDRLANMTIATAINQELSTQTAADRFSKLLQKSNQNIFCFGGSNISAPAYFREPPTEIRHPYEERKPKCAVEKLATETEANKIGVA